MASIRKEMVTKASPADVWAAIRDVGALHTRLVPGFVVNTTIEPGARIVTFGNGMVVRELIVDLDDAARRFVWAAEGGTLTHHNGSVQVFAAEDDPPGDSQTKVVWIGDFLPNDAAPAINAAMAAGMDVMRATLDKLASGR
jgi:hypothetical protein